MYHCEGTCNEFKRKSINDDEQWVGQYLREYVWLFKGTHHFYNIDEYSRMWIN